MNMLRVWGGGIYQHDAFYNIADELGLLLWQEFMFACALYPRDTAFLATVSDEVGQQLRRLAHHASIAIWGGNNENEAALDGWYAEARAQPQLYAIDYRCGFDYAFTVRIWMCVMRIQLAMFLLRGLVFVADT